MTRQNETLALFAAVAVLLLGAASTANDPPARPVEIPELGEAPPPFRSGPSMQLPPRLRQQNWGSGSCVHASTVMLLRWQGLFDLADKWRATYEGGEYSSRLIQRMEAAGLKYSYTTTGEVAFLEWAIQTRRGAGIFYKPNHAINLVGLDQNYAYLLDNNDPGRPERTGSYERVPRQEFLRAWRNDYGGFAWCPVYVPPPMAPVLDDPQPEAP